MSYPIYPDSGPACRAPATGVLIGDSIVNLMDGLAGNHWSKELLQFDGDTVASQAVGGYTTTNMLADWLASPQRGDPAVKWGFLMGGINDIRNGNGNSAAAALANINAIQADWVTQNPNATLVVAQILPTSTLTSAQQTDRLNLNASLAAVGARDEIRLALALTGAPNTALAGNYDSGDHLHPNARGTTYMAMWVRSYAHQYAGLVCGAPP